MVEEKKGVYPIFPTRYWWDLRKQFRRSIPGNVTDSYLATVLSINTTTASKAVLPVFKLLGIINQDGTTGDRATAWRDDEQYPQVCEAIVKELYPDELLDAFPEPSEDDRHSIEQWFARKARVGEQAAKRMAKFFLMLSEADATRAIEEKKVAPKREKARVKREPRVTPTAEPKPETNEITRPKSEITGELGVPSVNINIQVHISSDSSANQIDQIFESMARHLNIRRSK